MATRRHLFDPSDPEQLRPEERIAEVTTILAAGVLRLRERRVGSVPKVQPCWNWVRSAASPNRPVAANMRKIPPESGKTRLEPPRRSSPDGP